jgi:hypothetical protein
MLNPPDCADEKSPIGVRESGDSGVQAKVDAARFTIVESDLYFGRI